MDVRIHYHVNTNIFSSLDNLITYDLFFLYVQENFIGQNESMIEHYELQNLEQLRAIADMLRMRVIDTLRERPMTVTQLGEVLHMAPAKIHYHVRELEKVGLLQLVETREKGGILEKYYQPIARDFSVPRELLLSASQDELVSTTDSWFEQVKLGVQRALRGMIESRESDAILAFAPLYLTRDEQETLSTQLKELFKPYTTQRGIVGERVTQMMFTLYPELDGSEPHTHSETAHTTGSQSQKGREQVGVQNEQDTGDVAPLKVGAGMSLATSPTLSTWAMGAVSYSPADLERAVAQGKRLRIRVVGLCTFESDVSADLVERAVEQFSLVGKLQASQAIRDVLEHKKVTVGA